RRPVTFFSKIVLSLVIALSLGVPDAHSQNYGILKKIFDPDGAMGDNYGWSVSVSDSIAVVGAPMDDTGSVHVYFRNAGGMDNWGFVKRLTITDGASGDLFGFSVSVSDTIIAVGAPNQSMPGSESGAVYIFHRNAGGPDNWGQVAKIEDAGSQDHFGYAVSVSGTALAVGAPDETEGTVRIYYKDQGGVNNWGLVSTKVGTDSGDEFGYSIDLRDTLLIVGAPGDDIASNSDQGSAYVYYRDNDNWTLQQTLTAGDGLAQDRFGTSVAADSVTAVIGAPFNNEEGPNSGAAYIYQRDQGGADNWGYIGIKLVGSSTAADDEFGHSVSLSEDVILVGAPQDDDSGASSGTSFLFRQNQGGMNNWGETQRLQAFDAVSGDQYGYSVDIEGPFLYIGAPTDDDSGIESGSVYIYREDEIICPQTPTVDCQDITVYLDASGVAEISAGEINSGASASCEFNVTLSQSIFSCDDIGTVQVTLTLIDLIGNQVECVANVTVEDTLAPMFVNCPPDTLTVSNNAGACEGNVIWSIPVAQDNCLIDSIVQIAGPVPGTSIPLGIYDISYVAYDPQLLTDTCTFVLEIVDTQAPFLACPPDLTFDADVDECNWTSAMGQLDPLIAIDNCEPVLGYEITTSTGAMSADSGAVGVFDFPVGVNTICYTLTDSSMTESDTCCFTVTVLDTQAPSVTCPGDINVDTDPGVCEAEVSWTIPVPSDNCAVDQMTVAIMFADGSSIGMVVPPGDYGTMTMATFPEGVSSVVYTVTDTSGNMDACFFDVTVTDNEDPMLTCPGDVTVNTSDGGTGDCAGNYTFTHPTPTDNCEIASFTLQILNPSGAVEGPYEVTPGAMQSRDFDLGVSTISYIAVDGSGNSVSCNYTVTVVDDEDPEFITCPPDTLTVGTDVDVCGAFVNWPTPIAEDNCGVESVLQIAGPMQGDSLAPGFYTITYVAYDAASPANTDTCTFVLNVIDTQAPLLLCPSNDVVVSTDPGTCTWLPPAGSLTPTVAIGNCPYEITWEVYKDDTLQASGFDDVSGQHVFNLDTSVVCYYITETEDLDGNGILTDTCCFLVIVQDNEDPMITCPADVTFFDDDDMAEDCQHTMGGAALDASATDNCAVVSLTHDYPAPSNTTLLGAVFPVGVSVITWTAVDTAGNIETCSFTVTVLDNIDPFIDCPADVAIGTSAGGTGDCLGQYDWTHPTPTDNCEVTQYNYLINNADGTQSGPFDLAPLLNPNAPAGVFDASFDFQLGVSTITYFAADAAGNTFDCSFTVTVTDDEDPEFINCPADTITIGTDVDNCSAFVNWSVPIAEDNCEVTVTQIGGPSPGDELAPGFYTITYLAEDGAMPPNTDTCEFVVNVVDTQEPLILCPSNDVVVSTDPGNCTWFAPPGSLTPTVAIANCPYEIVWVVIKDDTVQATGTNDVSGQHVFNLDTSIVCYIITETEDLDGNGILSDTCCFMVIVQDNEDPMITCPADVTFLDDDDAVEDCQHTVSGSALDATATDNCAVVSITHDYAAPSNTTLDGAVFPVGITIVTWTAVDTAGNIETCSFVVTVEDNIDPFIDCPASVDIVTSDGGTGDCLGEYNWTHPTPTDNCAVTQYNYTVTNADGTQSGPFDLVPLLNPNAPAALFDASFDFQLGTSTIQYFAADAAGNTFDCSFTVSVTDDEDPEFVNCPETDTITIGTDVDNCSSFVNWSIPIAEDNCEVTVTQIAGPSPGDELAPGFYTITYLAEDGAMPPNTDTCEFVINVVDTQEPLILCPSNDVVVSTDAGTCTWFAPAGSLTPVIAIANCPYEVTWEVYKDDTLQASGFDDVSGQHVFNLDTSFVCYYITETEDLDGNGILTDTCCFMVIVQDNELPMITCPADVTFVDSEDDAEDCQHTVSGTALDATATDNCAVVSLSHDYPSVSNTTLDGAVFPVGITIVTWTAVDTAGNLETCRFVVTVEDDINPEVICPEDAEITTSNNGTTGDCLGEYDWTHPTPTDNCAVTQYNYRIINSDGTISGPFDLVPLLNPGAPAELFDASYNFQLDTSIVEYYAEDAAGNFDTCTFTVIVTDDEAPMFLNCPPDTVTFGNEVDLCGAYANYAEPIAEDNCEVMVTQVAGPAPSDFVEPGFYIVIWVAV
ncbi:MAG: HYR domain-containing protein, partial [Saprospiraceae bacterium]|nr:HYR domain-containing protein [Saprospiraceae bacterium]